VPGPREGENASAPRENEREKNFSVAPSTETVHIMEKRTLLAFVLSFLVLITWSILFAPSSKQPTEEAVVQKETPREAPPAQSAPEPVQVEDEVRPAPPEATLPLAEEKRIQVDTPLYRAVFTNAGPTIRSFKLKNYAQTLKPDSPPVELVTLERRMGDFLSVDFEIASRAVNSPVTYHVDRDTLRLGQHSSPGELVFRTVTPEGLSIEKVYRFHPNHYGIDFRIQVTNGAEQPAEGVLTARLRAKPPEEKGSYYSYVGLATYMNRDLEEVKPDEEGEEERLEGITDWVAYEDDYFISAVVPESPSRATFTGRYLPSGVLEGTYRLPSVSLEPAKRISYDYALYFGPRDLGILKEFGRELDRAVDFGWTDIIARPLLYVLRFFNDYVGNYGVSIILLTILVKILFWPLTHKSYKSMKEMQKLQPRMAKIREKYKDNREQMNKEMMALYRTYKVNPMSGCLPMVIQIPVFFALFRILGNAIELRHAPFMLWIDDLSVPDRLFSFPFSVPLMTPPYGIPVLTLLMGASMYLQQKMTPTPGDPTQAKIMMMLPIVFTFLFINFPSGLVLYWLVNNVLSIGQQYRIHKSAA
jgi:YidC/Oxa1 family membrane protein insertase